MKKIFIFSLLIFSFVSINFAFAATTMTGFIPGQIWYSKDPFIEGDTVKIYTAIWNNSNSPMSARVEFYDKNVILGTRDVTVAASSLEDVYVTWKVTAGDHLISAKIISPSITTSGKKEIVSVSNSTTETDKRFVPVVVNTINGTPATSGDIIKSQVDKATSSLDNILPNSISEPVSENVGVVDNFRVETLEKINENKIETEKTISEIKKSEEAKTESVNNKSNNTKSIETQKVATKSSLGIEEATEKPIAYLKLIFLSILSFVFGSKIIFYSLIILIIFFILRSIYYKIRNR